MKLKTLSAVAVLAASLFCLPACQTTYYQPKEIPPYSELKEKFDTSAVCMLYPHPMTVPDCDRLLFEELKKYNYSNALFSSPPVSLKELEADHVIQPLYLAYTYMQGKGGIIATYQLVVMVRPPGMLDKNGLLAYENPRYFQSFSRKTLEKIEGYPFFSAENMQPVIQNLFRNPEFRRALEPRVKKK